MLRLIHLQPPTIVVPIVIDDIDDGLPNKETHRLGSNGDPKAYTGDGYAHKPKQACYITRTKKFPVAFANPALPGYIDLNETQRVQLSAGKGKIFKHAAAGHILVVPFVAADLNAPILVTAHFNDPGGGDLTLTAGPGFLSLIPNFTSVLFTGVGGPAVVTQALITVTLGNVFTDVKITIPAAIMPAGVGNAGFPNQSFAQIYADDKTSAIVALT